ncbi:MAG: hypothetical protein ACRDLL_06540 [Solirubrobacterales bacterium]
MGILDEAIREHLELKRQHGAEDSELKQLEDEAFGLAERPGDEPAHDLLAEAPTEFLTQPETAEEPGSRREPPTIADLQEPPPLPAEEPAPTEAEATAQETGPADDLPAEEEQPAMEHEIVADAPEAAEEEIEPAGPSTEERQAISEQPTELFDVEEELEGPPRPSDEEIVEEEIAEPRLAPTDPLAGLAEGEEAEVTVEGPAPDDDDEYDEEDDAFWNEQRLSDELDQALEAPRELEPDYEDEPEIEVEREAEDGEEPELAEEPASEPEAAAPRNDDDVLGETPDFLEETPEDDQLWFEQKPPKDFDFDD